MENQNITSEIHEKKRSSNFELLRIIGMFFIVLCHFWQHGVADNQIIEGSPFFWLSVITSGWSGGIGNSMFMLISGYFLCTSNFNINKIIKLHIEVLLITIPTGIIFFSFGKTSLISFLRCFIPNLSGTNWFITCYIIFYLLSPLLNKLLNIITQKEHFFISVMMFVLGTVTKMIPTQRLLDPSNLYYFIMAFFIASYIRKYNPKFFGKRNRNLLIAIISLFFIITINLLSYLFFNKFEDYIIYKRFFTITDIKQFPIWIFSIFLICWLRKIEFQSKIINILGKETLTIYMCHGNGILRNFIWFSLFKIQNIINTKFALISLFSIPVLFIVCLPIHFYVDKVSDLFVKIISKKNNKNNGINL